MALNFDDSSHENGFWINALIGAIAAFVLGFIPFSTVLGGVVAAYLQKGETQMENVKVGAAAGGILFLPSLLALFAFGFLGLLSGSAEGFIFIMFIGVIGLILAGLYTIGACALGGLIAHAVWEDDFRKARTTATTGSSTETYEEAQY
ncbi:DUF5518 domain-containing protein [Haloarchaeobius iranensis]|uniref:DUF5518 domain-containing protein n=1 Tax=Haloarchaeobius iranensis TaxID=996166 RepID=A0A1G9YY43_9EURY|nr:DUF5518 domain-containing protein [Haloarchaeobius iranensis]SDN13226.1 hypothetical protein SAMN05192554_11665 [Haloarchaeobius iranensis]